VRLGDAMRIVGLAEAMAFEHGRIVGAGEAEGILEPHESYDLSGASLALLPHLKST